MTLHEAITKGDLAKVRLLLANAADIHTPNANGEFPLHLAIQNGNAELVQLVLDAGADPNQVEVYERIHGAGRFTPLGIAAAAGKIELVQALLNAGARANTSTDQYARDPRPRPALLEVILFAKPAQAAKIVPILLAAGADPNVFLEMDRTLLDSTEIAGAKRVAELLRKAGAKKAVEIREANPQAAPKPQTLALAAKAKDVATLREFLAAGANIDQLDDSGMSPLAHAASEGHADVFDILLVAGAKCAEAPTGWSLLTYAARGGHPHIVQHLLQAGFAVDGPPTAARTARSRNAPPNWHTPLMAACEAGKTEAVQFLLAAGADREAKHGSMTPLKWAKLSRHKAIVALLEQSGARNFDLDPSKLAVKNFPTAAATPEFQKVLDRVTTWTHRKPTPSKKRKGVYVAMIGESSWARIASEFGTAGPPEAIELRLNAEIRSMGAQILASDIQRPSYLLFPTLDPYAPLIASGTNGNNVGLDTQAVVEWFRAIASTHPFHLTGCSFDWCRGFFETPVPDPQSLAQSMIAFCPDLNHGLDTLAELTAELAATGRFSFWWD